ncbi:MAG: hypothetical protein JWM57_995 [Phycisphaerales bacterium]|nr:hypothetical protein [Phycisphaerales bacterium]
MDTATKSTDPLQTPAAVPHRRQKLTAPLDRDRSVITIGVDSTMKAFLAAIRELWRRGTAAEKQGVELPTFLAILRDQAERGWR